MFSTEMGSTADGSMTIYLRPETAQGIFVNYLNVQKTGRMKVPFGIAQIGKAFQWKQLLPEGKPVRTPAHNRQQISPDSR